MASNESLAEIESRADTPVVRRASKKLDAIKESGKEHFTLIEQLLTI